MYSYRIEQAIKAASILHKDQSRKGPIPYPYITHLMAVALLLHDYTDNEDIIVAGLLHDTVEDTDYTLKELEEDFGKNVRDIVSTVTEPASTSEKGMSWKEQKKAYFNQLKNGTDEALLVAAADKVHNMRSVVETYIELPDDFKNSFGGSLLERVQQYQRLSNLFNARLKNPIVGEFNHVFSEYKNFVESLDSR